jgi:capsular exopolysaccharide synthesis family protein
MPYPLFRNEPAVVSQAEVLANYSEPVFAPNANVSGGEPVNVLRLLKRHRLWLCASVLIGLSLGFVGTVLSEPRYQTRALMEFLVLDPAGKSGQGGTEIEVDLSTNLQKLRLASFQERVAERLSGKTTPAPQSRHDLVSAIRERWLHRDFKPEAYFAKALGTAKSSFNVRPIYGTRILEITCESTDPGIAAEFVNALAAEYIAENRREQFEAMDRNSRAVRDQLQETRTKLQEAEAKLQEFVRDSGNVFVTQDNNTLAETRLRELQAQISQADSLKLAKRATYETVWGTAPDQLPAVYQDAVLGADKAKIDDLKREQASLATLYMPDHYKVKRVIAEIAEVEASMKERVKAIREQVKSDYDDATRKENMLLSAYRDGAGLVSAQSVKANEYKTLNREAEILRQMYSGLLLQESQTSIADSKLTTDLRLIEPAQPESTPFRPKLGINLFMGLIGATFVTAAAAFIRDKVDGRIRDVGFMQQVLPVSHVSVIPSTRALELENGSASHRGRLQLMRPEEPRSEIVSSSDSLIAESFRIAVTKIFGERNGRTPRVIGVTSPLRGDGKTFITSNLGVSLAESGKRVLLIDLDLKRPRLHKTFDEDAEQGAANLLMLAEGVSPQSVARFIRPLPTRDLFLLPAGMAGQRSAWLLNRPNLKELLSWAQEQFDIVLVDCPPMLQVADARIISRVVDGVILVCRSEATDRESMLECTRSLRADRIPLLGTILNDWKPDNVKQYVDRYYYQSNEAQQDSLV